MSVADSWHQSQARAIIFFCYNTFGEIMKNLIMSNVQLIAKIHIVHEKIILGHDDTKKNKNG